MGKKCLRPAFGGRKNADCRMKLLAARLRESGAIGAHDYKVVCLRLRKEYSSGMKQFTAIIHRGEPDEKGFWATCLEVPGANGQGETKEECLQNLREAIQLMLESEREEAFRLDPQAETAELLLA